MRREKNSKITNFKIIRGEEIPNTLEGGMPNEEGKGFKRDPKHGWSRSQARRAEDGYRTREAGGFQTGKGQYYIIYI